MDTSSLFVGMAIGIVGAFGSGFLKKAGEDLYAWLKGKISPKSAAVSAPQVIVRLHDERATNGPEYALPSQFAPAAIERLSEISFDEIEKAIDATPPMQRENVANGYVGLKVEWSSYLRSANMLRNGEVSLRLSIDKDYRGRAVLCKVSAEEYQILRILPQGAHIRVSGEITRADLCDVELSNVRLRILPDQTPA